MTQTDNRTASERKEYFRWYWAKKRGDIPADTPAPKPLSRIRPIAYARFNEERDDVRQLRDGSGMRFWPERRFDHPETLEQTLARVLDEDENG